MSTVNQLLAKAMSTSSDDEAYACLKMARKKSNTLELNSSSAEYNGQSAKYWYDKAVSYYNVAKKKQETGGLSTAQQSMLYNMYKTSEEEKLRLYDTVAKIRREKEKLESKIQHRKNEYIAGIILGVTIGVVISTIILVAII